jgi:hypothetical protein
MTMKIITRNAFFHTKADIIVKTIEERYTIEVIILVGLNMSLNCLLNPIKNAVLMQK